MSNSRKVSDVQVTVILEYDLWARANRLAGHREAEELIREALVAFIQRESAHRLALLGREKVELPRQTPDQRLSEVARELKRACEDARLSLSEGLSEMRQVLQELRRARKD